MALGLAVGCGDDASDPPSPEATGGTMSATGGASPAGTSGGAGAGGMSGGMTGGEGGVTGGEGASGSMAPADAGGNGNGDGDGDAGNDGDDGDGGTDGSDDDVPFSVRAWPTDDAVTEVDGMGAFGLDVSGITYQASGAGPGVLWASMNRAPSTAYRLEKAGASWARAASDGWTDGKALLYPDGSGVPDAEGVTLTEEDGILYVGSESNLNAAGSRNAVLRYDVSGAGASLTATREWNLTSMLPATGKNLGVEALTWIPDSALVAEGFIDPSTGEPYEPNDYAGHGSGVFVVGLESQSKLYFFALGSGGEISSLGSAETDLSGVMGLEYDRDVGYLWAYCDNTCGNRAVILTVGRDGTFGKRAELMRPTSMPDINNEGIAIAPESECAEGKKAFFWVEDGNTNGHVLRAGTIPCGPFL